MTATISTTTAERILAIDLGKYKSVLCDRQVRRCRMSFAPRRGCVSRWIVRVSAKLGEWPLACPATRVPAVPNATMTERMRDAAYED